VFRLLFLLLLAGVAFVMIEAHWSRETMTLTLRVRSARELVATAQGTARRLGERAMERAVNGAETPPVAAAPPKPAEPAAETLRDSDRARLNKLVEEKSRGR
jgi:hypothetical protein